MKNYNQELIELTQKLIQKKSITPNDDGAINLVSEFLKDLYFHNEIIIGNDPAAAEVKNLYARNKGNGKILAFAGHTDVVTPGEGWRSDPFAAKIIDNKMVGRGTVDMKAAICAFLIAAKEVIEIDKLSPNLALLITGNEEGEPTNGTKQILKWLEKNSQEKISFCLVGEPTSEEKIADIIKIGRRGSINFNLTVFGKQGHVAYPHKALNPVTSLVKILNLLTDFEFDHGSEFFAATNLEITNIEIGNKTTNIIPGKATASFNIRYSDHFTSSKLIEIIEHIAKKTVKKYELTYEISGESFFNPPSKFSDLLEESAYEVTGYKAEFSTGGGTSDARFIKDICPVAELGLLNKTAHKVDEYLEIPDLIKLKDIYRKFIVKFCTI